MHVMKVRIWLLCACLALSAAVRAEAAVCISVNADAALLSEDGSEVIAPGIYDDIFEVSDGKLYALGTQTSEGMRYALGDAAGRRLTESEYTMFSASEGVVIFGKDNLFGAMDVSGEILFPAEYTQLVAAGDGRFLATTGDPFDDDADEMILLGKEAQTTGIRSAVRLTAFSDGRMPFQDPDSELYGYLAPDGSVAIEAMLETAGPFRNGAARVSSDGKLGLIGTDGEWLVSAGFDYLETGAGVTVGLIGREQFVVLNDRYEESLRIEGVGLEAALVGEYPVLLRNGMMEVYDVGGRMILQMDQSATLSPGLGGQLILSDGDWGADCVSLVDADGTRLERRDQHLIPLDGDRYAFIEMNVASYYSDVLEEIRYSCDYDSLRCGMMDAGGNEILPAEYLEIRALGNDRYLAVAGDGLRMTDADGKVLWTYSKEE